MKSRRIALCHRSNKCENANLTLFIIHSLTLGRIGDGDELKPEQNQQIEPPSALG